MPTKRPYPPEHYPASYFEAVRKAVAERNTIFVAAAAHDAKESARIHTKVKAMLRHVETFAGQDPAIVEAVRNKRIRVSKFWNPKTKLIYINVVMTTRPSEDAAQALADFHAGRRSSPF